MHAKTKNSSSTHAQACTHAHILRYADTCTCTRVHFYACVYTYTVHTYIHVPIPSSLPPPSHLSLSPSQHHRRSLLIPIRTCIVKITVMLQCPSHGWNMDSLAARWAYRKLESETSMCVYTQCICGYVYVYVYASVYMFTYMLERISVRVNVPGSV